MWPELETFIRELGAWGYPTLMLAALLEYVFPPFPGDTIVVLGGAWAAREDRSIPLTFALLTLGSMVGIAATWRLGRSFAGKIGEAPEDSLLFGISVAHLRRAQALMRIRGDWLLLANRFLPSFRSVLFIAAGASNVSFKRTLAFGTVSAALFNGMLLGVGMVIGDNAEKIAEFFQKFRIGSLAAAGLVLLLLLGRFLWQRARAMSHQ